MASTKRAVVGRAFYDKCVVILPGATGWPVPRDWTFIGPVVMLDDKIAIAGDMPGWPLCKEQVKFARETRPATGVYVFGRAVWVNGQVEILYGPTGVVRSSLPYIGKAVFVDDEALIVCEWGAPVPPLPDDSGDSDDDFLRDDPPPVYSPRVPARPKPQRACPPAPGPVPKRSRLVDNLTEPASPSHLRPVSSGEVVDQLRAAFEPFRETALLHDVAECLSDIELIKVRVGSYYTAVPAKNSAAYLLLDRMARVTEAVHGVKWIIRSGDAFQVHANFCKFRFAIAAAFEPVVDISTN